MKRILYISFLFLSIMPYCIFAQSGMFNYGAYIEISASRIVEINGNGGDYINDDDGSGTDGEIDLDGSIKLGGDWINQAAGSGNVFVNRDTDGEVEFNGSAAQLIDGSAETIFEKVKINNSAANVTLDVNATVEATLTLTLNDIVLGSNTLSLGTTAADATISGGSATTYIQADGTGVVKYFHKTASTNYTYPIGCASHYTPFTFNPTTSTLTNAYTTLRVTDAIHPDKAGTPPANYITRYWTLNQSGVGGTVNYNISYIYDQSDVVGAAEATLAPRKYSASAWTGGGSVVEGTNTLTWNGLSSFSDYTADDDALLPIELLSFDVELIENNSVDLTWSTASEINNDYFIVQTFCGTSPQSNDDWHPITTINGNGTTNTITNYQYTDNPHIPTSPNPHIIYYRLKQIDFNGNYSYSEIKSVQTYCNTSQQGISTLTAWYTGSTEQKIQYEIESADDNQITANLYDITGRIVATQNTLIIKGNNESSISTNNLPKGQYLLYISGTGSPCGYPNINFKKKITIF